MKNKNYMAGIIGMALVIGLMLSGCISTDAMVANAMAKAMADASKPNTDIRDYGVYDSSVPQSQQAELFFTNLIIKEFNGKAVNWAAFVSERLSRMGAVSEAGDAGARIARVRVPAGTHDLMCDYLKTEVTSTTIYMDTGRVAHSTIVNSVEGIPVTSDLKPGHRYMLNSIELPDGKISVNLFNITYTPSPIFGDELPDAPAPSTTPTIFEGTWEAPDNIFTFTGNTWEQTITNASVTTIKFKGTFNITDRLNLYTTNMMVVSDNSQAAMISGQWMPATKQAYYYAYSFEGDNLMLWLDDEASKIVLQKQ